MLFQESHRAVSCCCSVSTCITQNYNLPDEANETGELSSEVNKLNSNSPNEKKKTFVLPCEACKLNSNLPKQIPYRGREQME